MHAACFSAEISGNQKLFIDALIEKATLEHVYGRMGAALETINVVIQRVQGLGDDLLLADLYQERGMILHKLDRSEDARVDAENSFALSVKTGSAIGRAMARKLQGNIERTAENTTLALQYYSEAYQIFFEASDMLEAANCRFNAADIYYMEGKATEANAYSDEAILLFTQAGSVTGVGLCHLSQGRYFLTIGDYLKAERALLLAEKIFQTRNQIHRLAQAKGFLAELSSKRGDLPRAAVYRQERESLMAQVNSPSN